jgi:uncharacterized membrane protein YesL
MKAFRVMGRVLKATYDELFLCIFMSVVWWIGIILIFTAAPATMGINHVANRIANYKRVDMDFFWAGAKQHIWQGWITLLLMLVVPAALLLNIRFYLGASGWLQIAAFLWAWALLFFLLFVQYLFPLLWQQDEPRLGLMLRNALILTLRNPLYTFLMSLFILVLTIISVLLAVPLVLLLPAMLALAGNFSLAGLLQKEGLAPEPPSVPRP